MTVLPGHVSEFGVGLVLGVWAVGMRLMAAQPDDALDELLGASVLLALQQARITTKEAAALMKIDESQLRHGMRGEKGYHLSLNRLMRLPFAFWLHFSPAIIYLVAKKNVSDIAEDLGLRKSA
jgi:hypothetical protein